MTRQCTVCLHPERDAINRALVNGTSYRDIARQFAISKDAVYRHSREHLPATLTKAAEAESVASADDLLRQIRELQQKTLSILERQSKVGGDDRIALSAVREARGNLDLLGRLLGQLDNAPKVNVLVANPEWLTLRAVILRALEPYPEAREAVVNALQQLGS